MECAMATQRFRGGGERKRDFCHCLTLFICLWSDDAGGRLVSCIFDFSRVINGLY